MRNLEKPSTSKSRSHLEKNIKKYKYGGKWKGYTPSSSEIDDIIDLYEQYDVATGAERLELSLPSGFSKALIAEIEKAYGKTAEGKDLFELRSQVLSNVISCPVCGIDQPKEIDHFLPKKKFPVFSIYLGNLVPLCHQCNHKKGSKTGSEEKGRFLHPYFDILPEKQFLFANLDFSQSSFSFDFYASISSADGSDFEKHLNYQIEKLNLVERYAREINLYLGSLAPSLWGSFNAKGPIGVAKFLTAQADYETKRFHINDWHAVVLAALSENSEFCGGGFKKIFEIPPSLDAFQR